MRQKIRRKYSVILGILPFVFLLSGCFESYVTPPGGADMSAFQATASQGYRQSPKPAARLPVRLAVARVQSDYDYYQRCQEFSVVNESMLQVQLSYKELTTLQGIDEVVTVNKLLISGCDRSSDGLRKAALSLKAELLYIYTLDTQYDETDWSSAMSLYTLGLSPTITVEVTTNAMGILIDSQTGYVYGVLQASSEKSQKAAFLTRQNAWDQCSKVTQQEAFERMNERFKVTWAGILSQYGSGALSSQLPGKNENTGVSEPLKDIAVNETTQADDVNLLFWQ